LQDELVGVGFEAADASEEGLTVNPEAGTYLDELRDLLELRGEWITGREAGREWRCGRDSLREDA